MLELRKSYMELSRLETFDEKFRYLKLHGKVGIDTFGFDRWLNQVFYHSIEWKRFRRDIIIRDNGCDLGDPSRPIIGEKIIIHHINPLEVSDLEERRVEALLNPENAISTTDSTHKAIHYSDESILRRDPIERRPNDTIPWKL